jgi:DNA-binding IclR family transcriptional regulator
MMTTRASSRMSEEPPLVQRVLFGVSLSGTFQLTDASVDQKMQAIERAFTVLRALAGRQGTSSLAEVTRASGLPKSTVLRLLAALEEQGAVQGVAGRYAIGPGLAAYSHHSAPVSALKEIARPYMVEVAEDLAENVSLTIEDGDATLYLDTAVAESSVQVKDWTGERLPYHASSGGLALLSTWPSQKVDALVEGGLQTFTSSTVFTRDGLDAKFRHMSQHGIVWTRQEFSDDVTGVAAVIRTAANGVVGALNAYGPDYRFPGDRPESEIAGVLIAACEKIGDRLA